MGFRLLLTLFLFQFNTYAQLEDAWVYLNDKPNYEYFIENPILMLSQKSINMKYLKNIPIDFRDVPINESYIETIDNFQGLDVLSKSKQHRDVSKLRSDIPKNGINGNNSESSDFREKVTSVVPLKSINFTGGIEVTFCSTFNHFSIISIFP